MPPDAITVAPSEQVKHASPFEHRPRGLTSRDSDHAPAFGIGDHAVSKDHDRLRTSGIRGSVHGRIHRTETALQHRGSERRRHQHVRGRQCREPPPAHTVELGDEQRARHPARRRS